MLRAAADRSTHVRRRQEKLCRRWLTDTIQYDTMDYINVRPKADE